MADTYTDSLAGLVKLNDQNLADFEASAIVRKARLLRGGEGGARPFAFTPASNGTLHKYNRENVAPGVGFREIGAGLVNVARKIDTVTVTLKLMDATVRRDKALGLGYRGGVDAYMGRELMVSLDQAFFELEQQILNGTLADATGFAGLYDALESAMTIDAGGDGGKRVYVVYSTPESVCGVLGNDGIIDVGDVVEDDIDDGDGDPYPGLKVSVLGYMGVQIATPTKHLAAIVNLDGTATHLLTRTRIMDALTLMREQGEEPSHIIMSPTAREEYRTSLEAAAYSVTDTPGTVDGVPIVTVNSLIEDVASS